MCVSRVGTTRYSTFCCVPAPLPAARGLHRFAAVVPFRPRPVSPSPVPRSHSLSRGERARPAQLELWEHALRYCYHAGRRRERRERCRDHHNGITSSDATVAASATATALPLPRPAALSAARRENEQRPEALRVTQRGTGCMSSDSWSSHRVECTSTRKRARVIHPLLFRPRNSPISRGPQHSSGARVPSRS